VLIEQRHSRLQELLAQRGMSDLESLSAELRVSQSTVRRDLDSLERLIQVDDLLHFGFDGREGRQVHVGRDGTYGRQESE